MAAALNSMTGFGAARGEADWGSWSVEAKSVNGKSLDVRVNTPQGFDALERFGKAEAARRFSRGNVQIGVRIEPATDSVGGTLNHDLLDSLIEGVQSRLSTPHRPRPQWIATLMTVRGVVEAETLDTRALARQADVVTALQHGIRDALDALASSRTVEGRSQADLFGRLIGEFRTTLEHSALAAAEQPALLKARLETQLGELGATDKVDADRLAAEIALSAAKADVREELDRLTAHFDQAESLVSGGSPVGRKLEFLSQEIGRESNTLCSKSASLELTNAGLALKALNDQFKEQAANVE
ncbi:MAG: DUF1732 domain-containing protein [Pseudomonadota bacterium]